MLHAFLENITSSLQLNGTKPCSKSWHRCIHGHKLCRLRPQPVLLHFGDVILWLILGEVFYTVVYQLLGVQRRMYHLCCLMVCNGIQSFECDTYLRVYTFSLQLNTAYEGIYAWTSACTKDRVWYLLYVPADYRRKTAIFRCCDTKTLGRSWHKLHSIEFRRARCIGWPVAARCIMKISSLSAFSYMEWSSEVQKFIQ